MYIVRKRARKYKM